MLLARGCVHLNIQEDLGIESLRLSKQNLQPVRFLKKYSVRFASSASPLYVADTHRTGRGLYSNRAFKRGELVFTMQGERRHYESRTAEDAYRCENWLVIDKDIFIDPAPPYVFANHSCEPNLGIREPLHFMALRDIAPGEELTYDYSITTDELPWTMQCLCGALGCRKLISAFQYLPEGIYRRYLPYVGSYFQTLRANAKVLPDDENHEFSPL